MAVSCCTCETCALDLQHLCFHQKTCALELQSDWSVICFKIEYKIDALRSIMYWVASGKGFVIIHAFFLSLIILLPGPPPIVLLHPPLFPKVFGGFGNGLFHFDNWNSVFDLTAQPAFHHFFILVKKSDSIRTLICCVEYFYLFASRFLFCMCID